MVVLRKVRNAEMPAGIGAENSHLTGIRLEQPGNGFEKRALACPVGSDHRHAFTGDQFKGDAVERATTLVTNRKFVNAEDGSSGKVTGVALLRCAWDWYLQGMF